MPIVRRLVQTLRRPLGHPAMPLAMALLAAAVTLPALTEPLSTDDLILRERLLGRDDLAGDHYGRALVPESSDGAWAVVMHLFTWVGPGKWVEAAELIDDGVYPWYASEGFMLDFWRPLSSFTHWLDFQLWPGSHAAIHLHGILWFAVAVGALAVVYRRFLRSGWIAGLAAALYAVDQNLFFPVAWMSNRNVLLALLFGLLALLAHDRWRRRGSARAGVAAAALYALALTAGEPGVAILAYLGAYALFLDPVGGAVDERGFAARWRPWEWGLGGWLRRALTLVPTVGITVVWRLVYRAFDYGAADTGLYLDPGREPSRFFAAIAERAPLLLLGQLGWPEADLYEYLAPGLRPLFWGGAVAVLAAFGLLLAPLLRREPVARFWAVGMLVAVLPICASAPLTDRRLFFVGVGGMAVTAQLLGGWLEGATWLPRRRPLGWIYALAAVALLVVQVGLPVRAVAARLAARATAAPAGPPRHLALPDDSRIAEQTAVLVTAPHGFLTVYLPWELDLVGRPIPRRHRLLAPAFSTLTVERPAARELVLSTAAGSLMEIEAQPAGTLDPAHDVYGVAWSNRGFWAGDFPLAPGEERRMPGLVARVLEASPDGLPTRVRFTFDRPLEDGALRWLAWDWAAGAYRPFAPPPVGGRATLPGPFGGSSRPRPTGAPETPMR